jgi:GT2 family glycosyltransferase
MKISIGITTTPNRIGVFLNSLSYWMKFNDIDADFYFNYDEHYEGIPVSKNKVLSKCFYGGEYEHIIIVDDDIYPVSKTWAVPYVLSKLNHACWNYDRKVIAEHDGYDELETPNGCFLYFKRKAIQIAGGWDLDFKGYSYDHVNLTDRIFNNGLTPVRYLDVPFTKHLFKMSETESSVSVDVRANSIPINYDLYQQKYYSKEFKPFK